MNKSEKEFFKGVISVFLGIIITVFSFYLFFFVLILTDLVIMSFLVFISYCATIIFLILWNNEDSKKVYLLLCVPLICILTGTAIFNYSVYVNKISTIAENKIYYVDGKIYIDHNKLKLTGLDEDENSTLIINNNMPVLDGATALYPLYAAFVQTVYPYEEYFKYFGDFLFNNGTPTAYENLFKGEADIIFCAGPSAQQLEMFNDNNMEVKMILIGREAFVFFVNKENIVDNLTVEEIQGIYSGNIKNWKKLGGNNQRIRPFQRPDNSGSQTMLIRIMRNVPLMKPKRENVSEDMRGIINQVAVYRNFSNAIGYSFLQYSTKLEGNDNIKILSVNGIYPSGESIQDDSYPFSASFYAIYIEKEDKNENIEPFINWILSSQGQLLVSKTGYIPVSGL